MPGVTFHDAACRFPLLTLLIVSVIGSKRGFLPARTEAFRLAEAAACS